MAEDRKRPDAKAVNEAMKRVFDQIEKRPAPEALVQHAIRISSRKPDKRN